PGLQPCGFLGDACLSPTTSTPRGSVRARHEDRSPWMKRFPLDSVEPHWMNPNDLAGTLGAMPAEWSATSHDVTTRLMSDEGADPFPPQPAEHHVSTEPLQDTRIHISISRLEPRIRGINRAEAPGYNRCPTTSTKVAWLVAGLSHLERLTIG